MSLKIYGEKLRMKAAGIPAAIVKQHRQDEIKKYKHALTKWAFRFKRKTDIKVIK